MSGWVCEREGCGHNRSRHNYAWNGFRGEWDTSCRQERWGVSGRERCRCGEFTSPEADAKEAAELPLIVECDDVIGVNAALVAGRQAAAILEARPADLDAGYSDDEIAQQYAATDRLVSAFRKLDAAITGERGATA